MLRARAVVPVSLRSCGLFMSCLLAVLGPGQGQGQGAGPALAPGDVIRLHLIWEPGATLVGRDRATIIDLRADELVVRFHNGAVRTIPWNSVRSLSRREPHPSGRTSGLDYTTAAGYVWGALIGSVMGTVAGLVLLPDSGDPDDCAGGLEARFCGPFRGFLAGQVVGAATGVMVGAGYWVVRPGGYIWVSVDPWPPASSTPAGFSVGVRVRRTPRTPPDQVQHILLNVLGSRLLE